MKQQETSTRWARTHKPGQQRKKHTRKEKTHETGEQRSLRGWRLENVWRKYPRTDSREAYPNRNKQPPAKRNPSTLTQVVGEPIARLIQCLATSPRFEVVLKESFTTRLAKDLASNLCRQGEEARYRIKEPSFFSIEENSVAETFYSGCLEDLGSNRKWIGILHRE